MGSLVDYDEHYSKGRGQCGEPFAEFEAFFATYEGKRARVLDLGCGQGRDALLAARAGHQVVGVDLAKIGIAHMLEDARAEELDVEGVVSDVLAYSTRRRFDVVLLDRVLHLLLDDGERETCLQKTQKLTARAGHVLIADTPKHAPLIHRFFEQRGEFWEINKRTKNFLFARKR